MENKFHHAEVVVFNNGIWGMSKFVSHSKLQEFIPDDTYYLTIMCEVTIKGFLSVAVPVVLFIAPRGNEETSAKKCL